MKFIIYISTFSIFLISFLDVNLNAHRIEDKIDVIIIDAGHGGKDPGTTAIDGTFEKDFNLEIALRLKLLLENAYSDVKVILTRDSDKFIELTDRGKIANDSNGKLFVSIHANSKSPEESDKSGFELYLLDMVGEDNALAQISDYKISQSIKDDTLSHLLSSLILHSNLYTSLRLAKIFSTELTKGTVLKSRGIFQQPFVVLWGATMPSILVECGYLSDEGNLKYLTSETGKNELANSLYKAIARFKFDYEFQGEFK